MQFELIQIIYFLIILGFGGIILYLRRKARGSKSMYKLTLILLGIALSMIFGKNLDLFLLYNIANMLLIALIFEISMRLNSENIKNRKPFYMFICLLLANISILGTLFASLLNIKIIDAIIFSAILTMVEYFFIDELKQEGDIANPLIIIFIFSLIYFNSLRQDLLSNISELMKYILTGIGMGVLIYILISRIIKNNKITWIHELMLIFASYITYITTEYLEGFGILAVMIFGFLFGNSYVRKKSEMKTLRPGIFKSLEILIFMLIGFIVNFSLDEKILLNSIIILLIYYLIRLIVVSLFYKRYSLHNKIVLTLAPKGMVFGALLLVFTIKNIIFYELNVMLLYTILMSLLISWIIELFEDEKIKQMDLFFEAVKNIRYGRKRDLKNTYNKK
ncbi:MAG: hypothetical protein KatS3mg002_1415 [Candidatus Woesearchaeota archaeon]|nr:MAG: hypothetical protein KatS3mg002_1415 [Candidatus Woesearchaeota archaeon]